MKPSRLLPILLLPCLMLTGCQTPDKPRAEIPISQARQEIYLTDPKPPQEFGFSVYRMQDGITYAGNGRLHPQHFTSAKMLKDNIPVIKIRGKAARNKMKALIDFSSATSWLEFATAQKFDAPFLGINGMVIPYRGSYNTGGQNAYAGVIRQLRIDNLFIENTPFYIRMAIDSLGPLARGIHVPHVDAVLGYDNLREFEYIQVNLRNGTINFSARIPYVPHDELVMTTAKIVRVPGFGLAIEGAIFGKPTPVILDFAGDYQFARGDAKVNVTKQVRLGDIVFRQVPTLVLEPHVSPPRAGRQMLEPYIITICSAKGLVYFERPPE